MPPRPAGTCVVFAAVYCAIIPSRPLTIQLQDLVAAAERVQLGPAGEVLERVVGAVVGAPAQHALHVAAFVVILA